MIQKGILYTVDATTGKPTNIPIRNVWINFNVGNSIKARVQTDEKGSFSLDVPVGKYTVQLALGSTSPILRAGQLFEVKSNSPADAFTKWLYSETGDINDALLQSFKAISNEVNANANRAEDAAKRATDAAKFGADILMKSDAGSTIFYKDAAAGTAQTVYIKEGNAVFIGGVWYSINSKIKVNMPSAAPGNDYAVFIDKNLRATAIEDNFESPAIAPKGSVLIGGFHYGVIPISATVSSGGFATSGDGMIWHQALVDKIKGVNAYSFWDLRFRAGGVVNIPGSPRDGQLSNHGMVYDPASNIFTSIYHINDDIDKNGISKAGAPIASGTVLPVIPKWFGGNGSKKYGNLNWWTANELAMAHGARLMTESEFNSRAFGVTEGKSAGGGATTYPRSEFIAGHTSKIGCVQASGTQWYWGADASYRYDSNAWAWEDTTGGRGNLYIQGKNGTVRALFGGSRTNGAYSGSRCVHWSAYPWNSFWAFGAVAVRDLLIL